MVHMPYFPQWQLKPRGGIRLRESDLWLWCDDHQFIEKLVVRVMRQRTE